MKLKLVADENIPLKVVQKLRENKVDVISITEIHRGVSYFLIGVV